MNHDEARKLLSGYDLMARMIDNHETALRHLKAEVRALSVCVVMLAALNLVAFFLR